MEELLQAFFAQLWVSRPTDVDYRSSVSLQAAISHLREQTHIRREELASRLGVSNSRLAYVEANANITECQFRVLIDIAREYSMPNLAAYFESKLTLKIHKHVAGNKTRGRRSQDK